MTEEKKAAASPKSSRITMREDGGVGPQPRHIRIRAALTGGEPLTKRNVDELRQIAGDLRMSGAEQLNKEDLISVLENEADRRYPGRRNAGR